MNISSIIDIIYKYKVSICVSQINNEIIKKRQQVNSGNICKDTNNNCEWILNNCTALRYDDKNQWVFFCNICGEYFRDFSCNNCPLSYINKIIAVSIFDNLEQNVNNWYDSFIQPGVFRIPVPLFRD